ncbi:MAG TPA: thermonuclease [Desulfuromonas sp.]|nr:thermonuclease [Desulfuromonas sp.]HBT82091.1 thermonuclease [Desulfuromonas sp.]
MTTETAMRRTLLSHPWFLFCALLLLPTFVPAPALAAAPPRLYSVTWVYDGDTIEVTGLGKVRLIGIDVPEETASARDDYFARQGIPDKVLRRTAKQALAYTIGRVKGNSVRLKFDSERRDRHGRILAYVYLLDGRFLNRLLLDEGLAVVYRRFDFRLKKEFLAAEAAAREGRKGMWVY